jgi:aryl-alcohol dehydrogenase-like predicted oxidoreductase
MRAKMHRTTRRRHAIGNNAPQNHYSPKCCCSSADKADLWLADKAQYLHTKDSSLVDVIAALAVRKTCTTVQIALAWLLAQGDDIVPIPGTTRIPHLHDNLGALSVNLEPGELAELNRAVVALPVAGERYTQEGMKGVNA